MATHGAKVAGLEPLLEAVFMEIVMTRQIHALVVLRPIALAYRTFSGRCLLSKLDGGHCIQEGLRSGHLTATRATQKRKLLENWLKLRYMTMIWTRVIHVRLVLHKKPMKKTIHGSIGHIVAELTGTSKECAEHTL